MRIEKLSLKNFRGFEELEIDFPEGEGGLAVFIGVNGSGKTSILKAISYFFRDLIYGLYSSSEIKNRVVFDTTIFLDDGSLKEDIQKSTAYFYTKINFEINNRKFLSDLEVGESYKKYFFDPPIDRIIGEREYENLSKKFKSEHDKEYFLELQRLRDNIRKQPKIIVSYNADRYVKDNPSLKAKDITKISPIDTFSNSFSTNISFDDFFEWFRNTEDYESENIRFNNDYEFRLKSLEAIRNTLATFLPKYSFPRVKRQPTEQLVLQDNGHQLSIANLSHGERLVFAIIGDIIRRLSIANPKLENPCLGEGIVMIDEIEQHLHPSWQRTIIPNLRKTFPNIQFIITTHSPQVLSNVPRENVFILEDFKLVERTPHTFGRDTNSILYDLFGVEDRPPKSKAMISELYTLIDANNRKRAEEKLEELKKDLGDDDREIMRAESYIELMDD
ncbi:MAG: AAA family ATPase [Saprospiraceae bacterium]